MLLLLSFTLSSAIAGERTFAFSYGYGTLPRGGIEVEEYATVALPSGGLPQWEHQVELEYGISDHLEAGLYLVGEQAGGGAFTYGGYKARLRYRFGAQGVGPLDVAAYLEYVGAASLDAHAVEAKLIVAKDVDKLVTALNLEYKLKVAGGAIAHEIEPTVGVGYRAAEWFTLGVEGKGEVELGDETEVFGWVGPSMHLAGEGGRVWWTVAALLPLTEDTRAEDGVVVRSLVALNL